MILVLVDVERRGNVYVMKVDVPPYRPIITSVNDFHQVTRHVAWVLDRFMNITDRYEVAINRNDLKG